MDLSCGFPTCCAEPRILVKNIPYWSFSRNSEPQKLDDITGPVVPSDLSSEGAFTFPAAGLVTVEWVTVDILSGFVLMRFFWLRSASFPGRSPHLKIVQSKAPVGFSLGEGPHPGAG